MNKVTIGQWKNSNYTFDKNTQINQHQQMSA